VRATEALLDGLGERAALDDRGLFELDQRLHRHVWRCAGNDFLERTLDGYYVLTLRIWFLALDRMARLDEAVQEHRELLEAIRDSDPARAEDAMRRHILGFERAIREVL
jgi:DNA-binding GntR family transcriptional regulator